MDNTRRATLFAILAVIMAAVSAVFAADSSIQHVFIVLPLVVMGVFLFASGYYAGSAHR